MRDKEYQMPGEREQRLSYALGVCGAVRLLLTVFRHDSPLADEAPVARPGCVSRD